MYASVAGMLGVRIGRQPANYLLGRGVKQVRLSRVVDLNITRFVIFNEALAEVIIQAVLIACNDTIIGITGALVIKVEIRTR